MTDFKMVQLRLSPTTRDKITRLKERAGLHNVADAIRFGTEIALLITDAIRNGDSVLFETEDGELERLVVPQFGGARRSPPFTVR
jgi:hypothetical protein